jgi:hypothetical protein
MKILNKEPADYPPELLKKCKQLSDDLECLFDGEKASVVMNVLINKYLLACIYQDIPKKYLLEAIGKGYDLMKAHYKEEER